MASSTPTVARSIAEVTRESIRVEKLRGRVQTVFPIHACMTPTANNSETQDYGTVGSDGPIEGATKRSASILARDSVASAKVFQVTLRDLSLPGNSGANGNLHHRIDAYFYDKWADDHHSGIGPGDDIEVSGPAARLVHPDPSASDNGDHPFCLVFHTGRDDSLLALGAVAADHLAGVAGGSGGRSDEADDVVSCKVVRKAAQPGAGSRGGAAPTGRGGGGGRAKASYAYTTLDSIRVQEEKTNVYGVVCSFTHRHQSRGRDLTNSVSLLDESCPQSDDAVPCNFFSSTLKGLPAPLMVGDIVRLHRAKVQEYRGRPQLLAAGGAAWLVIRKKKAMRETYQKCPIGGISPASGDGDGGVDDEDPDPDDDSPPSGPDAGGGEADAVLPATDWEVQSSSANYTLSQVDQDRCIALSDWLATKSPHLWLKSSSEVKVWVQDIFRRPQSGDVISKLEVDLVCCLTSKHEKAEGGAGSLSEVYVADGTGFASSMPGKEWDDRRDAALLKGVRTALGKPGWSPGNPRPPPIPAHLKVEVTENKREVEDFVRHGPESDNYRLHFLFTLRLEDDYGVVDAIASGPDASLLLPGSPSPAEFYTSLEVRSRVERVLTRLESTSTGKARGGVVELRLRSYLAPLVEIRHRGDKCKRYSIIAPSCLEDQG
ncbi:POT1 protection of telomeres 1 homolog [Ectocarpus siliculosus]|uniref:POT1 protection of telomeres 1 homolog n=1 Tax=Ectocarpus siliculosus TaxID=2880 RepID=D7FIQ5_ECTSI|nr:POT1 protection of telomeres 1 homolog [Ectocarpus siliculosus]|eukprot:CBJ28873.1 POT1 protection of telomeres 1 homolog [Ectocarpus siliculosus]